MLTVRPWIIGYAGGWKSELIPKLRMKGQPDFTGGVSNFLRESTLNKVPHCRNVNLNFGNTELVLFVEMCFRSIFQIP